MADDPLDHLISATLAIEGEEARARRPALPFAANAPSAAAPEPAPIDSFHVDSGTVSEANPWPPEEAARRAPAAPNPVAPGTAPMPTPQWAQPAPPPPALITPGPGYGSPAGMPSAMQAMVARVVAGSPAPQPVAPPPRISDAALARGATASAYAASNAATEPSRTAGRVEREARPAPAPQAARERLDYLWHDKLAETDILRAPSMKDDPGEGELQDEWLSPQDAAIAVSKEAAGIRAILAERSPRGFDEVLSLYEASLDSGSDRFLCLVRGELALSFEPIEALRATLSVITPFLPTDVRLKDAYDAAQEALKTPGGIAPAIASSHKDRVDEALRVASRGSSAAIESVIERALIEGRSFSRRKVFGGSFLRGALHPSGRAPGAQPSSQAIPSYVSDAAAEELPLMRSFLARLIVEVRPSQDAVETHPLAFRVVAIAREVDLGARRR